MKQNNYLALVNLYNSFSVTDKGAISNESFRNKKALNIKGFHIEINDS